jgi:hypothetical protein
MATLNITSDSRARILLAAEATTALKTEQAASISRQLSAFLSLKDSKATNAERRWITIPNVQATLALHTDTERKELVARWVADIRKKGFTVDRTPTFPFSISNETGTLTQDPESTTVYGSGTTFVAGTHPTGIVRRSIVPDDPGATTAIVLTRVSNTVITTDVQQTITASTAYYLGNDLIVSF